MHLNIRCIIATVLVANTPSLFGQLPNHQISQEYLWQLCQRNPLACAEKKPIRDPLKEALWQWNDCKKRIAQWHKREGHTSPSTAELQTFFDKGNAFFNEPKAPEVIVYAVASMHRSVADIIVSFNSQVSVQNKTNQKVLKALREFNKALSATQPTASLQELASKK